MKSFEQLSEDLATRRAELKQRQREQGAAFKAKGVDRAAAGKAKEKKRMSKERKREELQNTLDAVG